MFPFKCMYCKFKHQKQKQKKKINDHFELIAVREFLLKPAKNQSDIKISVAIKFDDPIREPIMKLHIPVKCVHIKLWASTAVSSVIFFYFTLSMVKFAGTKKEIEKITNKAIKCAWE